MDLSKLKDNEVIHLYSNSIKELKSRGILRTNNVIGELGEYLAIDHFCKTAGLPKLQAAPVGTQNIDAISRTGDRYSIKSTSGLSTGVFYGLQPKGSDIPDNQKFEYVLICKFDENCDLEAIYQLTWNKFLLSKIHAKVWIYRCYIYTFYPIFTYNFNNCLAKMQRYIVVIKTLYNISLKP